MKKTYTLYLKAIALLFIAIILFPGSMQGNTLSGEKLSAPKEASDILPGLSAENLANADKWYYNEYRGGRNADAYPHWDWSTDYMCTLDFQGAWDEQNEGTTIQIRNATTDQTNPADLDHFDSFVYGSKKITVDNKIMSLRVRTHNADAASPAYFGVQVVDLSVANPTAVKIGETKTYGSGDYSDIDFDLSAYVGKEVVIAIGTYRAQTGDYWKQLVLRSIRFANAKVSGTSWLPGTEILSNWHLTQEMVRSIMPHTKVSFTGISPVSGNRDNYKGAYRSWRTVNHVINEWTFVPLNKDPEVFPSEGYLIKTRGNTPINTLVPESYIYAKFAITASNNKLTLKTRTFGSNYTFFKLTAIKEDGTVSYLSPVSNTATDASAATDGCWKFKNDAGGASAPETYASFVYDLSQFNGNNVVLAFSVHKGESTNTDENKLVFYSINLESGSSTGVKNPLPETNKLYSSAKGQLTIQHEGQINIYDAAGKLFETQRISGTNTISLPSGFYLVQIDKQLYKTIVR